MMQHHKTSLNSLCDGNNIVPKTDLQYQRVPNSSKLLYSIVCDTSIYRAESKQQEVSPYSLLSPH